LSPPYSPYLEFADSFDEYDPSVRPSLIQAQAFLKYEKQLRNLQLQEARLFRRYEKDRAELRELQQARKQKEAEALSHAAANETSRPVPPAEFGFEFSTAQFEQDLDRVETHPAPIRAQAA
jgi:hypothetical protein